MDFKIKRILQLNYNLTPDKIISQQDGWAALAYKITSKKGSFFLKVYEKKRSSTKDLTDAIDKYVPVLLEIIGNDALAERMPRPLLTIENTYKWEDESAYYILYQYIDGETIGNQKLRQSEIAQYAETIAKLHQIKDVKNSHRLVEETFEISFALEP